MVVASAPNPHLDMKSAQKLRPVADAIDFLVRHDGEDPGLEAVAAHAGLSPSHFQRLFKSGVGVSPKRFWQYLAAGRARTALKAGQSVLQASHSAGLSGPSRLHDLVVYAQAMTPGSVRQKGAGETVRYGLAATPFGTALIGATDKGICWLSFATGSQRDGFAEMQADWPAATFVHEPEPIQQLANRVFARLSEQADQVGQADQAPMPGLHIAGTNFQLKVWDALLRIPFGETTTYGALAQSIEMPKAARAVGSAVGSNAISVLIPCHRVIRASGAVQNYRWGAARKTLLLALEASVSSGAGER